MLVYTTVRDELVTLSKVFWNIGKKVKSGSFETQKNEIGTHYFMPRFSIYERLFIKLN